MDHFDFVIKNPGNALQYKIHATALRVSRMTIHWLWTKTNCNLVQHLQSLWLGYMPWRQMTTLHGHPLRCAICQGRSEVLPTWSPSSICVEPLSVDGTSLGAQFYLRSWATLVSQNTWPLRNYELMPFGRPARRLQQHGHVRRPPLQQQRYVWLWWSCHSSVWPWWFCLWSLSDIFGWGSVD